MKLTAAQLDRAAGALLGAACGDALGAGYEFGPALGPDVDVRMKGGGGFGWEPGEWTDDTQMSLIIGEVAKTGVDLRSAEALDQIANGFVDWAKTAKDVGVQTSSVLASYLRAGHSTGSDMADVASAHHDRHGQSGGNGSLMRTAPVALAYLEDPEGLVEAAQTISALTHFDPEAGEACLLWCLAIRHAVLHGTFDGLRLAVDALDADRRAVWATRLDDAETRDPSSYQHNGWVVEALMAAWSAISRTPVPVADSANGSFPCQHLQHALDAAVRGGGDTDTVAAIAGALLGARWGGSAAPAAWRRIVHGWAPSGRGVMRAGDLVRLGALIARRGETDPSGWPTGGHLVYGWPETHTTAASPMDRDLVVGGVGCLEALAPGVDAVVSLCRVGLNDVPRSVVVVENHVEVWLVDTDVEDNPNLDFVLDDTANTVASLRAEGHRVLLHCVQAQSRTPTVLALDLVRRFGVAPADAISVTRTALPDARPIPIFRDAIVRLTAGASR
jgi:ADP-ribosyl-[dinitrogen reductase] hydrolase